MLTAKAQIKINPVAKKNYASIGYFDDDYTQPVFPGGLKEFYKYLEKNVHYPSVAVKSRTQGKVIVTFVVEKNGTIGNVKVKKGGSKEIDAEAVRVLKNSPKWMPGTQDGKPVGVIYSIPIDFEVPKKNWFKKINTP
jgi:TonB family protein